MLPPHDDHIQNRGSLRRVRDRREGCRHHRATTTVPRRQSTSSLPLEMWSMVATMMASTAECRYGIAETITHNRSRVVA